MKPLLFGLLVLGSFSAFAVSESCGRVTKLTTSGYVTSYAKLDSGVVVNHLSTEEISILAAAKIAYRHVCVTYEVGRPPTDRSIELK